jgi:hypothetical protein
MNKANTPLSLPELRSKTDRELVILVGKEIERSLKFAGRGAIAEAEAAHLQAEVLLRVTRASEPQRSEMEARLNRARAAIDRGRPAATPCAQSVSC